MLCHEEVWGLSSQYKRLHKPQKAINPLLLAVQPNSPTSCLYHIEVEFPYRSGVEKKSSKSRKSDDQTQKKSSKSRKSDDATHESDDCRTKGFPSTKINAPWRPFVVVTDTIDSSQDQNLVNQTVCRSKIYNYSPLIYMLEVSVGLIIRRTIHSKLRTQWHFLGPLSSCYSKTPNVK